MSAIGDYIHYNANNYLRYGTSRKTSKRGVTPSYWQQIKKDIYNKVKVQAYNDKEVKEIQDQYNLIRKTIVDLNNTDMQQVRDKIAQILIKNFDAVNSNTVMDFERGALRNPLSMDAVEGAVSAIEKIKGNIVTPKGQRSIKYVNDKVYNLFAQAYKDLENSVSSASKKAKIESKLNDLKKAFNDLVENQNKEISSNKHLVGIHKSKVALYKDTYKEVVDTLRQYMGLNDNRHLSNAIGAFEEYIGAAIELSAQGCAADIIVENLEEQIKKGGAHQTKGTVTSDLMKISQTAALELKNSNFIIKDEKGKYSYNLDYQSSQKMDLLFTYDYKNKKQAALSIKNYNLFSGRSISLVGASPLSTFLFNMGNTDWTNHFLNIFAIHPTTTSEFRQCRNIANEAFGYYLLWVAMTGQGVGKKEGFADILVVNNNATKDEVKMWDMGSLINKIIDKSNIKNDLVTDPFISAIEIENAWEDGGKTRGQQIQMRLTKVLLKTHAIKISAGIHPRVLEY